MDPTQFWLDSTDKILQASDDLEYIFELDFGNGYLPRLVSVDANMSAEDVVRTASGVLTLETNAKTGKNAPQPVLARQVADYGPPGTAEVFQNTGKIGPSDRYPSVTLDSYILWWHADPQSVKKSTARLFNSYEGELSGQSSETFCYPFSSMAVTRNQAVLSADSLGGWLESKESGKLSLASYDNSGLLAARQTLPFQAVNMIGATDPMDETNGVGSGEIMDELLTMMDQKGEDGELLEKLPTAEGDILADSLSELGKMDKSFVKEGGAFFMKVMPTDDPTVFKGLIAVKGGTLKQDRLEHLEKEGLESSMASTAASLKKAGELATKVASEGLVSTAMAETAKKSPWPDPVFQLGGYMESLIYFDQEDGPTGKWKIKVLNGGFTALGGAQWDATITMGILPLPVFVPPTMVMVVPIPLRAELNTDLAAGVDFNAALEQGSNDTYYYTQLITLAYLYASYGLNFDLSIAAMKLGFFGTVRLTNYLTWLNSAEHGNFHDNLPGSNIHLEGRIGAEFEAMLLGISYKNTLTSVEYDESKTDDTYDKITKQWESIKAGNSTIQPKTGYGLTSVTENPLDSSLLVSAQAAPPWRAGTT